MVYPGMLSARSGFDPREVFANLVEKERVKGHHSPEGRAMRTLSRALSGWSAGALSDRDAVVLCNQAAEDWLRSRLSGSPWSAGSAAALARRALAAQWITPEEHANLAQLQQARSDNAALSRADAAAALEFCIALIDKRW